MRSFNFTFSSLATSDFSRQFWTGVLHFPAPTGDYYFADHPWTVLGNTHVAVVTRWGEIASLVDRQEKILDVGSVELELTNLPVLAGNARISDLLAVNNLETVGATLYCNFMDENDNIVQETIFVGVIQSPISYDFRTARVTIMSLAEAHLNQTALRVLTERDFPSLRISDIGSTAPIVFGVVPRSPGRVVKGTGKNIPIADPSNISTAKLNGYEVFPGSVSQDWTIIFSPVETAEFTGPVDGHSEVGEAWSTAGSIGHTDTLTTGGSTASSMSKSMTLNAACTLLQVAVAWVSPASRPTVSATWNGVAMRASGVGTSWLPGIGSATFWMALPTTGTHSLVVTFSAAVAACAVVTSYDNAMVGIIPDAVSGYHTPTVSRTVPSAGLSETHFVDYFARDDAFAGAPLAGQTTLETTSSSASGGLFMGSSRKTASTNPTTLGWTTNSTSDVAQEFYTIWGRENLIYAQSFTVASAQSLAAVRLRVRINPNAPSSLTTAFANLSVVQDNSGAPSTADGSMLAMKQIGIVSRDQANLADVVFDSPVSLSAGTYWLVLYAPSLIGPTAGSSLEGSVYWRKGSTGGYSGGNAQAGRYIAYYGGFGDPDQTNDAVKAIWTGGMSGQDFWFHNFYVSGAYSVYGSVSGFQGTGNISTDFISNNGMVGIAAADWQGQPAGGDRFCFTVDTSDSIVLLSESPSTTPVQSIDQVYWNETAVGGGATISNLSATGTSYTVGYEGGGYVAQSFSVMTGTLLKSVSIVAKSVGVPEGNLLIDIVRATNGAVIGPTGTALVRQFGSIPQSNGSIGSIEIDKASVPGTSTTIEGVLPEPLALEPGRYFLVINTTSGESSVNFYAIYTATALITDEFGLSKGGGASNWANLTGVGIQFAFEATAVTITKTLSVDDGTGHNVAILTFDAVIPDDVDVSAGIHGISSGSVLVTRPDMVAHWLLNWWDIDDSLIDLDGFEITDLQYPSSYRFDGVAQEQTTRKALLLQLAFESRSAFDWALDLAEWKYLPLQVTTTDLTIVYADVVPQANVPMLSLRRTDTTRIVNVVDLRYQRRATQSRDLTAYARVVNGKNLASIEGRDGYEGFGERENPEAFMMDFVRDNAMAEDLALYYVERLAFPRGIAEVTTKLHLLQMEKDDGVNFSL